MSSDKAHGPIYLPEPFIPTITPRKSKFHSFALRKKRGISILRKLFYSALRHLCLCKCLFNSPKARSWRFGIQDALAFIFCGSMFSTFYGMMEIQRWKILRGLRREFSRLLFPLIYIWLEDFDYFTFCIFKSQELVRGAILSFRTLSLVFSSSLLLFFLFYLETFLPRPL